MIRAEWQELLLRSQEPDHRYLSSFLYFQLCSDGREDQVRDILAIVRDKQNIETGIPRRNVQNGTKTNQERIKD